MITAIGAQDRVPSYPMSILRGCASIDEVDAFKELPDGFIRVVMRLIKKIDVTSPEKAIFARRETLAREAGKSCETVGRALRWLEDQGFIYRKQVTRKFLRGSDSHIHPTRKMIEALGFGHQKTKPAPVNKIDKRQEFNKGAPAVNSEGSLSAFQNLNINIHKQSGKPGETVDKLSTKPKPTQPRKGVVKIQGKSLPEDLAWLVNKGRLKATAVLKLMKLARNSGKLLSDVVIVTQQYLQALQGHELFAYVRSLIQQNKDYQYIAKQMQNTATAESLKTQEQELVTRKSYEWAGRKLKNPLTDRHYLVDKNGFVYAFEKNKEIGSLQINLKFINDVQEGRLVMCE